MAEPTHFSGPVRARLRRGLLALGLLALGLLGMRSRTTTPPSTGQPMLPPRPSAFLRAPPTDIDRSFGHAVAIDGDTIVVGASSRVRSSSDAVPTSVPAPGMVYVFVLAGSIWTQQAILTAANGQPGDGFGLGALAIDGDTIVVGALSEASRSSDPSDNSARSAGAAYVFTRTAGIWTQQGYLKASNAEAEAFFGSSVDISGDMVVVGAPHESGVREGTPTANDAAIWTGAAYVFVRTGATWTQWAYLKAANAEAEDGFGASVAIDGYTVVVGASGEDSSGSDPGDNSARNAGAAYVFVHDGTRWSQQAYLKAAITHPHDGFAETAAIDGNTIVIGAPNTARSGSDRRDQFSCCEGAAYVFVRTGTVWSQQAHLTSSNPGGYDSFGLAVAIDGNTVVVGSPGDDSDSDPTVKRRARPGAVYEFVRSGASWTEQAHRTAANPQATAMFGRTVAIDGDSLVVGAPLTDQSGRDPTGASAVSVGTVYVVSRLETLPAPVSTATAQAAPITPSMPTATTRP
jgi:hypothetical protein